MQEGQIFCDVQPVQEHSGGLSKWGKTDLKWHLDNPLPGIALDLQTQVYAFGFQQWQDVCGLTFQQTFDHAAGDVHVYNKRIDGPSGTLAYASLPGNNTTRPLSTYLDNSENWDSDITDGVRGIGLLNVFTHELGHIIGLDHLAKGNLMAAYYTAAIYAPQAGGIAEAVKRYGPNTDPTPPTDPPGNTPEISVLIDLPAGVMPGLYKTRIPIAKSEVIKTTVTWEKSRTPLQ